jgi:hypothetical protein
MFIQTGISFANGIKIWSSKEKCFRGYKKLAFENELMLLDYKNSGL